MKIPSTLKKKRNIKLSRDYLIKFELKIKSLYEEAKIKGPIHLSNNNEEILIELFQYIGKKDFVFSNWRNHLHALLHGVSEKSLINQIMDGKSMGVNSKSPFFMSSSIVGGTIPIALGTALSIKQRKTNNLVWCFLGDMTSHTGVFFECLKYSEFNNLPIMFVIEDNSKSTNTPTKKVWGKTVDQRILRSKKVIYYSYKLSYPHHGTGKWVLF